MTESEWLECTDPMPMLEFLQGKASDRKLRLFACACCRTVWDAIPLGDFRSSVLTAERYSEGLATTQELESALAGAENSIRYGLGRPFFPIPEGQYSLYAPAYAAASAATCGENSSLHAARRVVYELERGDEGRGSFCRCDSLRDIFGNPFRPIFLFPAWLIATVTSLAEAAYDERSLPSGELDPDRLAVLSDALEESGCDDSDILNHLRAPGPHVRGCWAVDLLLGRS